MAYCQNCGEKISDSAKFCPSCGAAAAENTSNNESRKTKFDGEIHKCPNCGEILNAFEIVCPTCNFELRGTSGSKHVKELQEKLEKASNDKQKITIINSFPVPNTREDIFEFMLLASSNFDANYYASHLSEEDISDAWLAKIKQCYEKAKLVLTNEKDLEKIKNIYDKVILECENSKKQEEIKNAKREKKELKLKKNELKLKKKQQNLEIDDDSDENGTGNKHSVFIGLLLMFLPIALLLFGFLYFYNGVGCNPDMIKVGISHEEAEEMYYLDLIELFENKGFTNVEARDDGKNIFHKSGSIKSITIDGKKEFYSFSKFSKDAQIVILYYS